MFLFAAVQYYLLTAILTQHEWGCLIRHRKFCLIRIKNLTSHCGLFKKLHSNIQMLYPVYLLSHPPIRHRSPTSKATRSSPPPTVFRLIWISCQTGRAQNAWEETGVKFSHRPALNKCRYAPPNSQEWAAAAATPQMQLTSDEPLIKSESKENLPQWHFCGVDERLTLTHWQT